MESFYKTLKRELVNDATLKTKDEARHALVSSIEVVLQQRKKAFCVRLYGSSGI